MSQPNLWPDSYYRPVCARSAMPALRQNYRKAGHRMNKFASQKIPQAGISRYRSNAIRHLGLVLDDALAVAEQVDASNTG